jgi:hypothetical protein
MEIYSKEHIDKFMNKINTKKLILTGGNAFLVQEYK